MRWNAASRFTYNVDNLFGSSSAQFAWYSMAPSSLAEFEVARKSIDNDVLDHANWDGYGAFAIGKEAKSNALHALSGLERTAPVPAVIPNPNGTISFEWENDNGVGHLEIGKTRFSFYVRRTVGDPILLDGIAGQVYGLGSIISETLYPKPSDPAYNRILQTANV